MNAKNKLIERLLKIAKQHKLLTYPVLALVAVISVFHYFFSWSTGAGKRVMAAIMVLVMLVSSSYFLTSSATTLVDDTSLVEEEAQEDDVSNDTEQGGSGLVSTGETENEMSELTQGETDSETSGLTPDEDEFDTSTTEQMDVVSSETSTTETSTEITEENPSNVPNPVENSTEVKDDVLTDVNSKNSLLYMNNVLNQLAAEESNYYYRLLAPDGSDFSLLIPLTRKDDNDYQLSSPLPTKFGESYTVDGHYKCEGWYLDQECKTKLSGDTINNPRFAIGQKDGETIYIVYLYSKRELINYEVTLEGVDGVTIGEQKIGDIAPYKVSAGSTVTFKNVKLKGHTLTGVSVKIGHYVSIDPIEKSDHTSGQDITIEFDSSPAVVNGKEYKQTLEFKWKEDSYAIVYAKDEDGKDTIKKDDYIYGKSTYASPADIDAGLATAKKGYEFDGWDVYQNGIYISHVSEGETIEGDMLDKLYLSDGKGDVVLRPHYIFKGIKLDKTRVEFQYDTPKEVDIHGNYIVNPGEENFKYELIDKSDDLQDYGIEVDMANGRIKLKTTGPQKVNKNGIELTFKITEIKEGDAEGESKECTINVIINPCVVTPKISEIDMPVKIYDGNTECDLEDIKDIPVFANGKQVEGIFVAYYSCEYESPDAGPRKVILKDPDLVGPDEKNYTLSDTTQCTIDGRIDKRPVYVKTSIQYTNPDRNYALAGESDNPKITIELDEKANKPEDCGLVDGESISGLTVPKIIPKRNDENITTPDELFTYLVDVSASDENSNYEFGTTVNSEFNVMLESVRDTYYQITTSRTEDGWYSGANEIQIQPVSSKGYDEIRIAGESGWQSAITLTEENTKGNKITFQLHNSTTGAFTAQKTIDVKVDQNAPIYLDCKVTTGDSISGDGIYFPSAGGNVSFGNYYNKTLKFSIRYKDERSAPAKLYYTLSGTLGNGKEAVKLFSQADEDGVATAEFEIIPEAVDKIGTIKFYAEDKAGNIEQTVHELTRNGSGEWSVEITRPEIVSWNIKSGDLAIVSGSDQYYSNCTAYLTAKDTTSGLYSVTWYINGTAYEERVPVTGAKVNTDINFTKAINPGTYKTIDGKYEVYVIVTDNAGNTSLPSTKMVFKVDDVSPIVNITTDPDEYSDFKQELKVQFNASDELSGIKYINVKEKTTGAMVQHVVENVSGGISKCYFQTSQKGTYVIEVSDYAGNVTTKEISLGNVSNEVPPCPAVTFSPVIPASGWITVDNAIAAITNVKQTAKDGTAVETKYQLWKDGETAGNTFTITGNAASENVSIPNGIYKLRVWSESKTGVLCTGSANDGHVYTVQVDSKGPVVNYELKKTTSNTLTVNFTVSDAVSGVNSTSIQVLNGTTPVSVQVVELGNGAGYSGSFNVTKTGNYSIVAKDIAGNETKSAAFTPMSMKVNAVKNISTNSAVISAQITKGTYPIKAASISYRKYTDNLYVEADTYPVVDQLTNNWSVSAMLSNLQKGTKYVYKVTALSEEGEVLEYIGYFETLSDDENGITITGTTRYSDGRKGRITVGLYKGNSCVRSVEVNTAESNTFTFYTVPDGNYTIVATDGVYAKTSRVLIENKKVVYPNSNIDLVLSGKNTSVEITTDETPDITADNMDSLFSDETNFTENDRVMIENEKGTVEFKLSATLMNVSSVDAGTISAMYSAASNKNKVVGAYLDLTLYKIVTDENGNITRKQVHELGGGANVSVTIPLGNLANKSGLEVIRIHNDGDSYVGAYLADQDNNPYTYTITTTQFSTYAVLHDPDGAGQDIPDDTLKPSDDDNKHDTTENPDKPKDDNPVIPDDDKPNDKGGNHKPSSGGGYTVGSLKSTGSAKTGDETPIAILFGIMLLSTGGLIVLRKKSKEN